MSTFVRPPSGPVAPTSIEGPSAVEAGQPSAVGETSAAQGVGQTEAAAPSSAEEVLLARLSRGEITREQAIDGLVARALEAHGASRLSPTRRLELEEVLRATLSDDPALAKLLGQ